MVTNSISFFSKALFDISRDEDVMNNLSNIKIALSALNCMQLEDTSSNLNLSHIFDCLNSSNKEQIDLTCEILKTVLNELDPVTVIDKYGIALLRALHHPNVEVKELVLQQLNRMVVHSKLVHKLCNEPDLLLCVVECVGHSDNTVARPSIQFLIQLGKTLKGINTLFSPVIQEALNDVIQSSDTNRFRVYEVIVEISTESQQSLENSSASGLLNNMLEEVKGNDILVALNILEMLTKLALTEHGFQYLESRGVVRHFADMLCNKNGNPILSFLLPGLLKFFGNVAQLRPEETFQNYPDVIAAIFRYILEDSDQNTVLLSLETVGYIASTACGKWTLNKKGGLFMKGIMKKVLEIVIKWPTDSRVRGLNVLANLLRHRVSEQDTEMTALVKGWFDHLGPTDEVLFKLAEMAQQPFPEIKLAVMMLLQVLAERLWSQQYIRDTPGLIELLLDRNCDSTMREKDARYEVIQKLAHSSTSEAVFGEEMVKQFNRFTTEGAAFVPLQTEVAIERGD